MVSRDDYNRSCGHAGISELRIRTCVLTYTSHGGGNACHLQDTMMLADHMGRVETHVDARCKWFVL